MNSQLHLRVFTYAPEKAAQNPKDEFVKVSLPRELTEIFKRGIKDILNEAKPHLQEIGPEHARLAEQEDEIIEQLSDMIIKKTNNGIRDQIAPDYGHRFHTMTSHVCAVRRAVDLIKWSHPEAQDLATFFSQAVENHDAWDMSDQEDVLSEERQQYRDKLTQEVPLRDVISWSFGIDLGSANARGRGSILGISDFILADEKSIDFDSLFKSPYDKFRSCIEEQFPEFSEVNIDELKSLLQEAAGNTNAKDRLIENWLRSQERKFGETLTIRPLTDDERDKIADIAFVNKCRQNPASFPLGLHEPI